MTEGRRRVIDMVAELPSASIEVVDVDELVVAVSKEEPVSGNGGSGGGDGRGVGSYRSSGW